MDLFTAMRGFEKLATANPQDIKAILVTKSHKFIKFPHYRKTVPEASNGLFFSEGKFHAWLRKLLNPVFQYSTVQSFSPVFCKHAQRLVEHWGRQIRETGKSSLEIVVEEDLNHLTLDVTCETIFGHQANTISKNDSELTNAVTTYLETKFSLLYVMLCNVCPVLGRLPFGILRKCKQAQDIMKNAIDQIIEEKRNNLKQSPNPKSRDLMDIMMDVKDEESNETLTTELLRQNALTFMVAGLDTTSSALTWLLYFLATNPDKQERAREEARAVLSNKSSINVEDVTKLSYITATIKESLRLSAPPITGRMAIEDVSLGDIVLPKGCGVMVMSNVLHQSEGYWEKADDFVPKRHLDRDADNEMENRNFMSYFPFSAGPRICIGKRLAMLNMEIILAFLLQEFKFTLPQDHPKVGVNEVLTLKPSPSPRLEVSLLTKLPIKETM